MGNVISLHTEIFVKRDESGKTIKPSEALWKLTEPLNGSSYNGYPMIIKQAGAYKDFSIRISYGEKYVPRRLFSFYEENKEYIDKIFVRTNYEGDELDHIISLPTLNQNFEEIRRTCRYGFDEILFKLKTDMNLNTVESIKFGEYESVKINGSMNSVSCLIDIDDKDIICYPIENRRSLKTYALNEFESSRNNLLHQIIENSSDVIFKYKNISVHRKIDTIEHLNQGYPKSTSDFMAEKYNKGKYDINSSGWHNCIDKEYLTYLTKIERDTTHTTI